MKTLRWLLFLSVVFVSSQVRAQAKLGITIDSFPTQLISGDTTTRFGYFSLHNFGIDTFNGVFTLNYTVNGTLYNSASDSGISYPGTTLIIAPTDSSPLLRFSLHTNTGPFSIVGSSGVVIWPISPSALTFDTAAVQVEVTFPAGTNPVSAENLKVFILNQQLIVNSDGPDLIKSVRVYNILGQLLTQHGASSTVIIPMNNYVPGCYLAEVILTDNSKKVFKVINNGNR